MEMGMVANSLIVETLPTATCKRGARIKRNSEESSLLLNDYYAQEIILSVSHNQVATRQVVTGEHWARLNFPDCRWYTHRHHGIML